MSAARYIITGTLTTHSPLALRTGYEETNQSLGGDPIMKPPRPDPGIDEWAPVAAILVDHNRNPCISGSAIKGLLRSIAAAALPIGKIADIERLLGGLAMDRRTGEQIKNKEPIDLTALGGIAEFCTATLVIDPANPKVKIPAFRPPVRGRTAIHEGSRTAEGTQLRHDRVVAPGQVFDVTIHLSGATEADVALLLGLLATLDGTSAQSALGAGNTQGDGRVAWTLGKVEHFGRDQAKDWLKQFSFTKGQPVTPWAGRARPVKDIAPEAVSLVPHAAVQMEFSLQIEGHFLVSAVDERNETVDGKVKTKHYLRPHKLTGAKDPLAPMKPILPGSSLDGALRAQARRIFRTMANDYKPWADNDTDLPAGFEALFGSDKRASMLQTEDFAGVVEMKPVEQHFVAIDRFSGGASDHAKFSLIAFEAPRLTGTLTLVLERKGANEQMSGKKGTDHSVQVTPAAIGLLALTLKDLACGDIPLGHATRKGYGGVESLTFKNGSWPELLEHLGSQVIQLAAGMPQFKSIARLKRLKCNEAVKAHAAINSCVMALEEEAQKWADKQRAEETTATQHEGQGA